MKARDRHGSRGRKLRAHILNYNGEAQKVN